MGGLILVLFPSLAIEIMLIALLLGLLVQVVRQAIDITKRENAAIRAKLAKPANVSNSKVVPISTTEADEMKERGEKTEVIAQPGMRVQKVEPDAEPI